MSTPMESHLRSVLALCTSGSRLPVEAIEALVAGDPAAEDLLLELVRSRATQEESWAPVWAIIALGERRSPRTLPDILECLKRGTDVIHEAVEFALLRFGGAAIEPIIAFLEDNPALEGRLHLYSALAATKSPRAVDYLIGQLRRDVDCVAAVSWALAETRDLRAIEAIEREAGRRGARDPELLEALEAAHGKDELLNPLFEDWRTQWLFDESALPSEEEETPEPEPTAEEDGLNLHPRYYDVQCPACRSDLEYDSHEDAARVLRSAKRPRE